ncbi:MFS transporter [Paenibacillus sp. sgz500958]|uniref:MFS transporter n=1 Tax=Paenibacillus sp. sgz500958 TaxID=3242475 RepID=UPI0036D3AF41
MDTSSSAAVIRGEREYFKLFAAGLVNGIGDRFSQVAMLSLIFHLTGSGMAIGVAFAVRLVPSLFLAPLGGILGSKLPRKVILISVDLLRIPFALSFLWVTDADRLWLLYTASFFMAAGEAIYAPMRKSLIPLLARPDSLLKINGLEQLMTGCVLILGAFTGGIVSLWFGPELAFVMNAASFLLAAVIIYSIKFPKLPESYPQSKQPVTGLFDVENAAADSTTSKVLRRNLLRIISVSLPLQLVLVYELLVPMVSGLDNVLISVYALKVFDAGDAGVGIFYAALGMGLSCSFVVARMLKGRLVAGAVGGLLLEGVLLACLSVSGNFVTAAVLYIFLATAGGVSSACLDTLVMKETPVTMQPMLFGILAAVGNTLLGLSMLLAGWMLELIEPRRLGMAGGFGLVSIALVMAAYALLRSKKDGSFTALWKTL